MYIKKIQAEVQVQYFSRLGLQVKRPADAGFPWPVSLFSRISKKRTNGWATDRVEWQLKWLPKTRKRERKVNDKAPRPLRREVLSFGCYFRVLVLGCRVAGQHTLLLVVHRALNRVLILPATFCILCSPSLSSLYILSPVGPFFSSLFEQSSLSSLLVLLPELGYLVSTARPRMAPAAASAAAASDATLFLFLFSGQSGSSSLCSSFGSTLASALTYELRVDLHVSHCPCPCSGCCRRCRCFACHHYYQMTLVQRQCHTNRGILRVTE